MLGDVIKILDVFQILQLELLGQSLYDFVHPCDHEELRDILTPRRPGEVAPFVFLFFFCMQNKQHDEACDVCLV